MKVVNYSVKGFGEWNNGGDRGKEERGRGRRLISGLDQLHYRRTILISVAKDGQILSYTLYNTVVRLVSQC